MNNEHTALNAATRPVHIAGLGASLLVIAAASGLFLIPTLRAARASSERDAELVTLTGSLDQVAGMNRTLTVQIEQLEASLGPREVRLTGINELNARLAELTNLCVESDLTPEVIQPRESVAGGVTVVVPIRFEVLGSLEAVDELLRVFDDRFPDLHIRQMSIEHTGPGLVRFRSVLSWLTDPAS